MTEQAAPLGDPTTLADCMGLCRALAWKFLRQSPDRLAWDDLNGEALYALSYANRRFDPSYDVPFRKYAVMVICHRLRQMTAWWRRYEAETAMPRIDRNSESEWQPAAKPDESADPLATDAAAIWEKVADILPERHATVVRLFCQEGNSLADVGRELGITRQRAGQLFQKAAKKLRSRLATFA